MAEKLAYSVAKKVSFDVAASPMEVLLAAPGLFALFDSEWGYTLNGSRLSMWVGRMGHAVSQPSSPLQPAYGTELAKGRRGVTGNLASLVHMMQAAPSPIAAKLAGASGVASYSSLLVRQHGGAAASRFSWGVGSAVNPASMFGGYTSTAQPRLTRQNSGGGSTHTVSATGAPPTPYVETVAYDGALTTYDVWVDGAPVVTASANTRNIAGVDALALFAAYVSGGFSSYDSGTLWCLLFADGIWSTAWRQRLERAAKAIWGTA